MPNAQIETIEFKVPTGKGYLIGNTLRQYAMRGSRTWQPAGYRIASKEGSFGFSRGYPFNYLDFLQGRLVSPKEESTITEKLCKFEYCDGNYVCGDMTIVGLEKLRIPTIDVCLVYSSGFRTQVDNYHVVESVCGGDVKDFAVVPSRHTDTIKFSYTTAPYDMCTEILTIQATPGAVETARANVVQSISGLHI